MPWHLFNLNQPFRSFIIGFGALMIAGNAAGTPQSRSGADLTTVEAALRAAAMRLDSPAASPLPTADDGALRFTFTPGVYLARAGGESSLGDLPGSDDISLETDYDLDDGEYAPNFELAVTKGSRWQIDASGFDFSTDASGALGFSGAFGEVVFTPGDEYQADFEMTSLALSVSYWFWHPINSVERNGSLDLRFACGAGMRWLSVEQSLELTGTSFSDRGEGEWLIPEAIIQLDLNYRLPESFFLLDRYQVLALVSVGPAIGGDGGTVVTLRAGMRFWLCEAFSCDFGFRLIEAGVESEGYEFEGGLQGLFLSATLRF